MSAKQLSVWLAALGFMATIALCHRAPSRSKEAVPEVFGDSPNSTSVDNEPTPRLGRWTKKQMAHEFAVPASDPLSDLLAAIAAETDPLRREQLLSSAVDAVSIGEIPSILAALQTAEPLDASLAMSERLVRRWAEIDVQAAAHWAEQQPDGPLRDASLNNVAIAWAMQDYYHAAEWARGLPSEAARTDSLRAIAYEVTPTAPVDAVRLAAELPPSTQRDQLVNYAAMEWASLDAASTVRWARQITDPALRAQVLAHVAMAWADQDPESAATLVATELLPGRVQADAAMGVAERWVQVQPEAALTWVQNFPEGPLRETALENLAALWPR